MVMKAEPVFKAVEELKMETPNAECRTSNAEQKAIDSRKPKVILMSPAGRRFDQELARELSAESHLIIICGHYEGVDHRVVEHLVDEEISIGDYVLTNGGLPTMVVIDAVVRLLPGALGDEQSAHDESFSPGKPGLEYPHYTRPAEFRGLKVPEILLSGHHAEIEKWRAEQARKRTAERRPDLLGRDGARAVRNEENL